LPLFDGRIRRTRYLEEIRRFSPAGPADNSCWPSSGAKHARDAAAQALSTTMSAVAKLANGANRGYVLLPISEVISNARG